MKTEKIVISFIAVIIGILVAGIAFYIYQSMKVLPSSKLRTVSVLQPTPTPASSVFITLQEPTDEDVVDKKVVTVAGKTVANATVVVSTDTDDKIVTSSSIGDFSTTVTIGDGSNTLEVTAVASDGQEAKIQRTITYSTESF